MVSTDYLIPDVTGDLVADVAKTMANSPSPMTLAQLSDCYVGQFTPEYVRRAAVAAAQIGLVELRETTYSCSESYRDILKKANKSELRVAFRGALQNYGPFLLFADYLNKAFTTTDAATRTRGLFKIQVSPDKVERVLKGWGKYAELIEETRTGSRIKIRTEHLPTDYVKKLVDALEAELQAKLFTIDMLGPEVFAYLDHNSIKLDDIAKALRNYESDPKPSASRSLEVYERFVYNIASERNVNVQKPKGLMEWIDGLRSQRDIPSNLLLLCHGMVGMRNMTHHNRDSETGHAWHVSKQAALTTTLLVAIVIRTLYLYIVQRKQEF
jgi:hypothetical protein